MHYMSIVFHDYVYRYCFWNLFASIFSTSVETNYLDRSIAARVLVANCLSPFFGWELFMCTGTSYDNNNVSYTVYFIVLDPPYGCWTPLYIFLEVEPNTQ